MSKKIKDTDYLYITSYIRARESSLLTSERINRMLDSKSVEDAVKVLEECGYGVMTNLSSVGLEKKFSDRRDSIMRDISSSSPSKDIVGTFRAKYDYHNAKVLIKSEAADSDGKTLLSGAGRIHPEVLADAYVRDDLKMLPSLLAEAMREAKDVLARTDDPRLADFVLDKAYYSEFSRLAAESGSEFLVKYGKLTIDSANLRTAVRSARMDKDTSFLRTVLTDGGNIGLERILSVFSSNAPLASLYMGTPLYSAALAGDEAIAGGRLTRFEKLCDNALTSYLSSAKLSGFSERVLIAYICAIETEISTARIIMTGLMAGLSSETIRERLRDSYV